MRQQDLRQGEWYTDGKGNVRKVTRIRNGVVYFTVTE